MKKFLKVIWGIFAVRSFGEYVDLLRTSGPYAKDTVAL